MTYQITIKNIPDEYTKDDIEQVIEEIKEPATRYFVNKEGTGITWLPDSDIQVCMRELD